jgi:hypothetical protein
MVVSTILVRLKDRFEATFHSTLILIQISGQSMSISIACHYDGLDDPRSPAPLNI